LPGHATIARAGRALRDGLRTSFPLALLVLTAPPAFAGDAPGPPAAPAPIASAFVFPVGDELDFKKPAPGEPSGYHISDPYLAVRKGRKHAGGRIHYGVDLSAGQAGLTVRAVAAGVVDVCEANALVKVRKAQRVKVSSLVKGKRVSRYVTRYRTTTKWRTGWGNRVVIRHTLPDGQVVYSLYAHLLARSVIVHEGDVVAAGQPIARVGQTGRATAPHLHIEIRTTKIDDRADVVDPDDSDSEDDTDPGDRAETVLPHTVDPVAFLTAHVMKLEDLEPGTWEARYALAAVKDGIMSTDHEKFEPDDEVTRDDFYAALVAAFHLGTPFTKSQFDSCVDALIDTGILDSSARSSFHGHDRVERSDALELVLRCLDHGLAHGLSMSRIPGDQLARDFNQEFAGREEAQEAERESRKLADDETAARRKAARLSGKAARKRAIKVEPVKPVPILDPGFESLAQSDKKLSRAEVCLLIASALRLGSSKVSALERAATRAAKTG
jgi:murein DD-endopeptidase MepM/ murein hydrolase activator NlpD